MSYLIYPSLLVLGLALLIWGAGMLIRGAESLAGTFGISHAVIGALVLGFGTSMPELAISVAAAINQTPEIAYGNAVGSNIANSALILGTAAVLSASPVIFAGNLLRNQLLLNLMAVLVFVAACLSGYLGTWQALIFLTGFAFCVRVILRTRQKEEPRAEATGEKQAKLSFLIPRILFGLVTVVVASQLTVIGAGGSAHLLGVSEQLIALSLVAFGTSLPELVITIRLAKRNHPELILGNLLGSNIFNLFLVLPVAHLFVPFALPPEDFLRDGGTLLLTTLLFFFFCFSRNGQRKLGKTQGVILLCVYFAYILSLTESGLRFSPL